MADTSRAEVSKVARVKGKVRIPFRTISSLRPTPGAGKEIVEVHQSPT